MEREGVWERRGERGGRAQIWEVGVGRWRDGALEEWSSGGASERRGVRGWGGGHSAWTMDEQRWGEREREPLEVLKLLPLFLFLSSSFLSILMGASPPSSFSFLPPSPRRLWYTRSTCHPPPPPSLLPPASRSVRLPAVSPSRGARAVLAAQPWFAGDLSKWEAISAPKHR